MAYSLDILGICKGINLRISYGWAMILCGGLHDKGCDNRPSACLDTVTRPSACLDTVPQPSAMPSKGASPLCHDMPRQGALASFIPRHGDSA